MSAAPQYYYELLNSEQKKAYHAMKTGLTQIAPSFPVPRLSGRELADIYFVLRMDHPEIFYTTKFTYRFYPDAANVELIPEYMFPKAKIKEHQSAMEARVRKLVAAGKALKTDEEKQLYIHDFICANVHYDKLKKPYSHEIIGALGNGVAVCEGIAKAVKILCDGLGIWCIVVLSENNPEKGIKYRHAWNIMKIGKNFYHFDATFDNSLSKGGPVRYDYVNLSDKQIFRDHEPSIWKVPACVDGDHFYYKEKKISFTKQEEVIKRAVQAIKKKKPFLFHWRGGYLTRELLVELYTGIQAQAAEKGKQTYLSVNWPQAVIYMMFADAPATAPETQPEEEPYRLEQANEAEVAGTAEITETAEP